MRMDERQFPRVEHQAALVASVAGISDDGMALFGEMHAYLVLASALEMYLHERSPLPFGQHPVLSATVTDFLILPER